MSAAAPTPPAVSPAVRRNMQANRGRDTSPELAVRTRLHAMGLRYRVGTPLPFDRRRRADIFFSRVRLYVFIDGCYWHGCPKHFVQPKTNVDFWHTKIHGNAERDADTTARLQSLGYEVLRFWEHDDPDLVAATIADAYLAASAKCPGAAPGHGDSSHGSQSVHEASARLGGRRRERRGQ